MMEQNKNKSRNRSLLIVAASSPLFFLPVAWADFIKDSHATLNLRNYYMKNDFKHEDATRDKSEEWVQAFILKLESGYTEGPVGFGVDVLGTMVFKLDGGRGTYGTQLLPTHDGNDPADNFGRLGVSIKARYSDTVIRAGEFMVSTPILASNDGRAKPQTFRGAMLTSTDFDPLKLTLGHIRQNSPRNDASMEDMTADGYSEESDRFNFGGLEYAFNDKRTVLGAWFGQLQDIYKQSYLEVRHTQPLADNSVLQAKLGYFDAEEDGGNHSGDIENNILLGQASWRTGAHALTFAFQRFTGHSAWIKVNGASSGALPNDVFTGSFNNPQERSWQLRYEYDFAGLGLPGLTLMTRYVKGTNAHAGGVDNGKERSQENELGYVVQSGTFKDLSMRLRYSIRRADFGTNTDNNQTRFIANYPISLF